MIQIQGMQGDEATAAEKLRQLELNPDNASRNPVSLRETKDVSNESKLLVHFFMCKSHFRNLHLDHIVN